MGPPTFLDSHQNLYAAYELYSRSVAFGKTPSEYFGLKYAWTRYCFDEALFIFGRLVDNALQETDKKGKPVTTLRQLFGAPANEQLPDAESIVRAWGGVGGVEVVVK